MNIPQSVLDTFAEVVIDLMAEVQSMSVQKKEWPLQGKTTYQGLKICIENKKGSIRSGKEPSGKPWSIKMPFDYGYVASTNGVDGDEVDCFIGPNKKADHVFIVHQRKNKSGIPAYDEDKCFLGWDSADAAKKAYHAAYNNVDLFHSMTMMSIKEFKEKLKTFSGKKLHASLQAGGVGSGRKKSNIDPKLKRILQKEWKDQTDEERRYVAQKDPSHRQNKLFDEPFNLKAGGPGSGRHPWGRKAKPSKELIKLKNRAQFLQKHSDKNREYLKDYYNKAQVENKSKGLNSRGKPILNQRQRLAVKNTVMVDKALQDKAEEGERLVTKALSGIQQHNNSPMDVVVKLPNGKQMGLEVKTLLLQKNDKITMKSDALARKIQWRKDNNSAIGTVVLDMRNKGMSVFYRQGVGSFRVMHMQEVQGGLRGLANVIGGK